MAEIDARIPLMYRSPDIQTPNQNRLQALAIQGKQMEIDQTNRALSDQNALSQILRSPGAFDSNGMLNPSVVSQAAQVAPSKALGLSNAVTTQNRYSEIGNTARLNQAKTMLDVTGRLLSGVTDEASYQAARQQAGQLGLSMDKIPATYDPTWVKQQVDSLNAYRAKMGTWSAPNQSTSGFFRVGPTGTVELLNDPSTGKPLMPITASPVTKEAVNLAGARGTAIGKAEGEAQGEVNSGKFTREAFKAASALDENAAQLDRLKDSAQTILKLPGFNGITGLSLDRAASIIPGTPQADAVAQLKALRSQIAQNVLQMYRRMSQTGGAVGQVSDKEQELFQNNLAALSQAQSPKAMRETMQQIIDFVDASKGRLRRAYDSQYGKGTFDAYMGGAVSPQGQQLQQSVGGAPSGTQTQPANSGTVQRVTGAADYDTLPSGTQYYDPNGVLRTKR